MTNYPKIEYSNIDLTEVGKFLQLMPSAGIISSTRGEVLAMNELARAILGKKSQSTWRELKEIVAQAAAYKNDIVKDVPNGARVIRYYSFFIPFAPKNNFIFTSLTDATEEWWEKRQKDILEYLSNSSTQITPTDAWLTSVLKRLVVMMEVKKATVMLYNRTADTLTTTYSSEIITDQPLVLKIGQGIAGRSAALGKSLVYYPKLSKKHKQSVYKFDSTDPFLSAPMMIGNRLIGILNIREGANKYFKEQDRSFYEIVASRLALALEHRRLVDRLKQERDRLAIVIDKTYHGKALLDKNHKVLLANPAMQELLETRQEIIGKNIVEFLPELAPFLEKNEDQNTELELSSLEGQPWAGVGLAVMGDGQNRNTVLTIRDITAEKQLDQIKNDFIATATHELRTPLTAIRGYLSMLKSSLPTENVLTEKQANYLAKINKASENLSVLVEELLSVLRIDQEALVTNRQKLKLLPITRELWHSLEPKAAAKKIKITLPRQNYTVLTDINCLQKVMLNLLDNAIKYTRSGGRVNVSFKKLPRRKLVRVDVKDTGIGVPARDQKRIFDKFYRAHSELSIEAGGTGLGLYIAKTLAQRCGGDLWLEKSGPKGSLFSFTIPIE